jgi:hypothetical protein
MLMAGVVALTALGLAGWRVGVPGSASASAAGIAPAFSPAEGWNTLSTGSDPAPPQAPSAIAANVPIAPSDAEDVNGFATANGLSGDGVVIVAWLYDRNDDDTGYPARLLPLQLSDATLSDGFEGVSSSIGDETLIAGVGDWDIELHAFFGTNPPTQAELAAAQQELDRSVIPTS